MPDPSLPLTPMTRRADAAAVVRRGSLLPASCAMLAAELLDAVSAAVLRTAGCTDDQAREALAALWAPPAGGDPPAPSTRRRRWR